MSLAIRRATVDDAQTLSTLAAATFVETFGHLYPPEDLQAFLDDAYAVDKQARILAHPDYAVWLLETAEGRAVGHCAAGPCGLPHADVAPGDGELKRLYVLREFHGGSGTRLMDTAMAWLLKDGPRTLWVGVWSENLGAQRFYARYGFRKAGTYGFPVGRVVDLEFILRRPVDA